MWVLSMWLMKKSRKVVPVMTSMKDECVSLPKPQSQLAQLHDDDEDVFATSLIDRYGARPVSLQNMCLATFAVTYDVIQSATKKEETDGGNDEEEEMQNTENDNSVTRIKLQKGLGVIRKRKQEAILHTRRYKIHAEPEKYYHAKLLLYYPWNNEDDIISPFTTYHESYISKQDIIHQNAERFNEDCVAFDLDLQDLENNIPQSAWEMVAPNIAQDDRTTHLQGFSTLQNEQKEKEDTIDTVCHDNTRNKRDTLCMLYAKAAKRQDMNFQDYCRHVHTLNKDQCHIVMYNRAWCKSYINALRHGEKQEGYRIFLSGPGGTGKSHVVCLIQRDMSHFFKHTVKPDDDQPIVLITAPTGSAAFQIGGSTIHSAFLLHDNFKSKPSWEKRSQMQLKLEHMMLSITDEISMVGFKQFQSMNQTMCTLKGTTDGNWGDICVLAVGNLYQLPPVGQCPIYMSPQIVHTLNDIAPNGWEKMQLHELTQSMRQKDMKFINCLNKIHVQLYHLKGSEEDRMLQSHELKLNPNHENYPHDAMHVYAQNVHCDAWNENRLKLLPGREFTNIATDSKKDDCTELANVTMPTNPHETGNLQKVLTVKINARVMITTNIDVADGLTNGAMGTVTNVVIDQTTGKMSVILVAFDSEHVGQETRYTSVYNSIHQNAVPIH